MTEMVYGSVPVSKGEPILPKWWRTVDKWTLMSVMLLFSIGILLGLAASPPLAEKNGFAPFHYVQRQAVFGGMALIAMFVTSMMSPILVRRLAVLGFIAAFIAVALLPVFGTDFPIIKRKYPVIEKYSNGQFFRLLDCIEDNKGWLLLNPYKCKKNRDRILKMWRPLAKRFNKMKIRPSPCESATNFKNGKKLKGNNKKYWIVKNGKWYPCSK